MVEYKPWAEEILTPIVEKSDEKLPILDIQLGGACNLSCIYCDTPKYGAPCDVDLKSIERLIKEGNIEWIYVCGLGEPSASKNLPHLLQLLKMCKENNVKLSMFSNILNFNQTLFDYVEDGTLHVLFKLDTFDVDKAKQLYGATTEKAKKIYENLNILSAINPVTDNKSSLGASIVPTSINQGELQHLVDFCMENNIFPLIGQLEDAGKGSNVFQQLEVKDDNLLQLKNYINKEYGVDYQMPICPATISAVHITNRNKVIVDDVTGLSCPWFWLGEPKLKELGDIREKSYDKIVQSILTYREEKFPQVLEIEKKLSSYPFGGCGGDAKQLLKTYTSLRR